jgi:hypothetical protein
MSEIVFILGAGASVAAGAPVMGNFLDRARDLWADPQRLLPQDEPHFRRVFDTLQALQVVHSKSSLDLINIENVFTLLEMAELLNRVPGNVAPADEILSSFKKVIAATLSASVRMPVQNQRMGKAAGYDQFVDLLQRLRQLDRGRHTVSVVTFNYDLALDFSLLGHQIDYGLADQEQGIPLLKLHGSLNWVAEEETRKVQPLMPNALMQNVDRLLFLDNDAVPLNFSSDLVGWAERLGIRGISPDPVIVPPTWKKGAYQQSLSRVWQRAASHLNEAQYIFICGYSLPDTDGFFKLLYALGTAGGQPLRTIHSIDPDPRVEQRFKDMLGPGASARYHFQRGVFAELPNAVLSYFGK